MLFDTQDVSGALTRSDTADGADVSYNPGGMAPGSAHSVELTYADSTGASETRTWSFTVAGSSGEETLMTIEIDGANVTITWTPATGALEESDDLLDWNAVAGSPSSPYAVAPTGEAKYYRVMQ